MIRRPPCLGSLGPCPGRARAPGAVAGRRRLAVTNRAPVIAPYTAPKPAPSPTRKPSTPTPSGPAATRPTTLASVHQPAWVTRRRISHWTIPNALRPARLPTIPPRALAPVCGEEIQHTQGDGAADESGSKGRRHPPAGPGRPPPQNEPLPRRDRTQHPTCGDGPEYGLTHRRSHHPRRNHAHRAADGARNDPQEPQAPPATTRQWAANAGGAARTDPHACW